MELYRKKVLHWLSQDVHEWFGSHHVNDSLFSNSNTFCFTKLTVFGRSTTFTVTKEKHVYFNVYYYIQFEILIILREIKIYTKILRKSIV